MSENTAPLRFNFHNTVAAEIFASQPEDATFFIQEYGHHRVTKLPAGIATVVLKIGRRNALTGVPTGYTWHTHKFLARWAYQLEIQDTRIEIEVLGNQLAVPMVHHMLLHPSLRYLAAQNGMLMLHAGAVASGGRSLILTGQGGAGKTTTSSLLLSTGGEAWLPHADDYVFLRDGPKSLAYLTRSHLYLNLLDWIPELRQRLSVTEYRRLFFFGKLRTWSQEQIKWPVRLPIERLWPDRPVAWEATPAGLVLINRTGTPAPRVTALTPEEYPLEGLIAMNFSEARHFLHLLRKSRAIPDFNTWQTGWEDRERQLLQDRMAEMPVYALELPRAHHSPSNSRQDLTQALMNLIAQVG